MKEVCKPRVYISKRQKWGNVCENSNPKLTKFILKNIKSAEGCNLSRNKNPVIVNYMIKNIDEIHETDRSKLAWSELVFTIRKDYIKKLKLI
jgi:hypothetical protein